MIGAALLALPGIILLAIGTPRQARMLFGERLDKSARRVVRIAGMATLSASLAVALGGDDRARHLAGWIGTIGVEALMLALLFTAYGSRSRARPVPRQSLDRSGEIAARRASPAVGRRDMTKT